MPARNLETSPLSAADLIQSSPVALAFKIMSDRWSWLILRDSFVGVRRFEDLRRRSGAARGTLTSRLNSLVEDGILYRNPYQTSPARYEYRLTDKGFGLYPVALLMWAWENKWTDDHEDLPGTLTHKSCGKATTPVLRCSACQKPLLASDVSYFAGPAAQSKTVHPPHEQRRRRSKKNHPDGVDKSFFHVVDIIGDRWTGMLLAAIWFNQHRYDDIAAAIGIATNILSDRLKMLTATKVLERRAYRSNPVRYEYRMTEKGLDLYGATIMLHQWSNRWLVGSKGATLRLEHSCGAPLKCTVACEICSEQLQPHDVSYDRQDQTDDDS